VAVVIVSWLYFSDPYDEDDSSDEDGGGENVELKPMLVDIDLDLTAFSNATR
jgi:hypothetical protein